MRLDIAANIHLRSLERTDAERIFELVNQNRERLGKWLPWVSKTQTVEDSVAFLEHVEANHADKMALHCGIISDSQLVGLIGLRLETNRYTANIGYWLCESASGKGLVTCSVRSLCCYGFEQLNLERIEIRAGTENTKSWMVPERLGFSKEGRLRRCEKIGDRFIDHYLYSLLKTDKVDWR